MKILLHLCCGPCSIFPLSQLKTHEVVTYFYNPNIHPIQEFYKRMESSVIASTKFARQYIIENDYGLIEFTRLNTFNENSRCLKCYAMRMKKTAEKARELHFDAFSSSLLYSRMQNHDAIKEICTTVAKEFDMEFYYEDFRSGWEEGINLSKEMELYRQNYCGCIYSEMDRFQNQLSKKFETKYKLSTYTP